MSEKAGTVAVTVKRTGNLNQYAIVLCRTEQGSATSTSSVGSSPGQQDYVEYAGQVSNVKYLGFLIICATSILCFFMGSSSPNNPHEGSHTGLKSL